MKYKVKITKKRILVLFYLTISYYCFSVQENYLYSTVLPKGTYVKLSIYGWLIVSVIIFFCIRYKNDYSKHRIRTIDIVAEGLTFFAAIGLAAIWLPVCLVLPLKLNSISRECSVQVSVFQIENVMVSDPKGRHISPDYTRLTIRDLETNRKMQLYMPPNIMLRYTTTHLSLTYCKGNFGWYILKSDVQFFREK